jgi:hypothetical protein
LEYTQQLDAAAQTASLEALDRTACSMATITAQLQQHKQQQQQKQQQF